MKKGRIVLLLSLLCVAQAFPLMLNTNPEDTYLKRDKRHGEQSNIADTEVRTIISAIVDAILDGDKKKRSEIPEDDAELDDKTAGEYEQKESSADFVNENNDKAVIKNKNQKQGEEASGDSETDNSSGSVIGESGESIETESGSGSAESGFAESSLEITKRNLISGKKDEESGSGDSDDTSGSGNSDGESEDNQSEYLSAAMEKENNVRDIPYIETGRTKRDEEGQDRNDKLLRNEKRAKTNSSSQVKKDNSDVSAITNDISTIHPPVRDSQKDELYYALKNSVEAVDIDFDSANIDIPENSSESSGSGVNAAELQGSGSGNSETETPAPSDNTLEIDTPVELTKSYFPETEDDEMYSNGIAKRDMIASEEGTEDGIERRTKTDKITHSSNTAAKMKSIDVVYLNNTNTGFGTSAHTIKQEPNNDSDTTEGDSTDGGLDSKDTDIVEGSGLETSSGDETSGVDVDDASASGVDPEETVMEPQKVQTAGEKDTYEQSSGEEQQESGSGIENIKSTENLKATDEIENTPDGKTTAKSESNKLSETIKNESETDDSSGLEISKDRGKTYTAESDSQDENSDTGSADGDETSQSSGEEEGTENEGKVKENITNKAKIIHQIVSDMAKAAVASVDEMDDKDDDDQVVKKSFIAGVNLIEQFSDSNDDDVVITSASGDDEEVAKNNMTEEPIYQGDAEVIKQNGTLQQKIAQQQYVAQQVRQIQHVAQQQIQQQQLPHLPLPQVPPLQPIFQLQQKVTLSPVVHAYEIDNALKSLIRSILTEDSEVKMELNQMQKKREETEEKLERDIIDLMPLKSMDEENEYEEKEKVITEVKDFEGYVDALSQQQSLDPWKHDVVVRKLERDLLNHLSIPESEEELLKKEEDELMELSEMEYIKDKISEVEENTSEFAQRHSENLEEVRQFAISSLTPIIQSLPLRKRDLNELANKVSKSAWLRMVTNSRRKAHARKIKDGFKRLMLFD